MDLLLFLDWNFYVTNLTAILEEEAVYQQILLYEIINGEEEFRWSVNGSTTEGSAYLDNRYEKTTGVILYSHAEFSVEEGVLFSLTFRRKGYVISQEISSETSSNSTSLSTTNIKTISDIRSSDTNSNTSNDAAFVPGFNIFLSFTASIATFTLIRHKNTRTS